MPEIEIPAEKAEELFRRHGAGVLEGGKIRIHPLEALYFIEKGKLELKGENFDSLFRKIKEEDNLAAEKYAVLKSLRQNGYIVRPSFAHEPWMRIYRKGFRPGEDRARFLLKVVRGQGEMDLLSDVRKAAEVRKELVYAVFEKGKIIFLKAGRTSFD